MNQFQTTFDTASVGATVLEPPQFLTEATEDRRRKRINARYELAERTAVMNEQFARATPGSARMAQAHADRATVRDRVRHEMHEADPWMKGSARTTVVSVVGRGPWLEVKIPDNPKASKAGETERMERIRINPVGF